MLAAVLVAFAVVAIIRKRSILEIFAYLVPALCFPIAAVSEYSMAVDYGAALLFVYMLICGENCVAANGEGKQVAVALKACVRQGTHGGFGCAAVGGSVSCDLY